MHAIGYDQTILTHLHAGGEHTLLPPVWPERQGIGQPIRQSAPHRAVQTHHRLMRQHVRIRVLQQPALFGGQQTVAVWRVESARAFEPVRR